MPADPRARRSVMRGAVGPHAVLLDLRDLALVGDEAAGADLVVVDLRRVLGVSDRPPPGQRVVLRDRAGRVAALELDRGLELYTLELRDLHPFPPLLRPLAGLACLKGVAELRDGGLAFLVDPALLLDAQAGRGHSG